jgi:hypothetical protein
MDGWTDGRTDGEKTKYKEDVKRYYFEGELKSVRKMEVLSCPSVLRFPNELLCLRFPKFRPDRNL